jgi:hypothetical protein
MILDELEVFVNVDDEWVTRLRHGHFVWCVKEKQFAKIAFAMEPPAPGSFYGRIAIRRVWRDGDEWGVGDIEDWYVTLDGKGFDECALLLPVVDNCPDEVLPISEPWQRQIHRALGMLAHRVEQLDAFLTELGRHFFAHAQED